MAFVAPPAVVISPLEYQRLKSAEHPNLWPVYFGARMASHAVQDVAMKLIQWHSVDQLKQNLPIMLGAGLDTAAEQVAAGPTGDVAALRDDLERLYGGLYDNWAAGIFEGMGGAYSTAMDRLINTGQFLYAYKTLAYHTAVTPRLRRHWNKTYTPMVPDASMAWVLHRRGWFTYGQYEEHAAMDGWSKEGADQLNKDMLHIPNPREAFFLWTKGQIDKEQLHSLYFAGGFDAEWHDKLTENYQYLPSIYDLTRIADSVELDPIWALDVMTRRGVKTRDMAKIWEMLQIRPLREEIRSLTTLSVYARRYGYWSHDDLDEYLVDLKLKSKERELINDYGDLSYEIELKEEWIEILRWRFRTATITEAQFMEGLTDPEGPVAMLEEKANLIVEAEKARGYSGYY